MKKYIFPVSALVLCFLLASCLGDKPPVITDPVTSGIMPDPIVTSDSTDGTDAPPVTTAAPVTTEVPVTTQPRATEPVTEDTDAPVQHPHTPGRELGSGFVISDSGTKLNLLLNWSAVDGPEEGTAVITVKAFLECYSIFVGERFDGELGVGEEKINYSTPQLEIPGAGFNEIDFGTYTFTVKKAQSASTTLPITASWHFRGVYAGLSVDYVTIDSTISFDN